MLDAIRSWLLPALRLPPDPQPPLGAPGSVRVFRAGRNFYKLALARWGVGQAMTLVGIVISLGFLWRLERDVAAIQESVVQPRAAPTPGSPSNGGEAGNPGEEHSGPDRGRGIEGFARKVEPMSHWFFPLVKVVEALGVLSYLAQLIITLIVVRLEYELRWYMVTDRSLRIRSGVWNLQEITMSFANLQQVVLSQGPLQRLLGIADVRVQSAGGGGGGQEKEHERDSLHTGIFNGVTNAAEIRDLIQARLREFREAGLGDPDDVHHREPAGDASKDGTGDVLDAARELLEEARGLRLAALEKGTRGERG